MAFMALSAVKRDVDGTLCAINLKKNVANFLFGRPFGCDERTLYTMYTRMRNVYAYIFCVYRFRFIPSNVRINEPKHFDSTLVHN